jgi:Mg2+ and Co2+ transporter CorA
MSELSQTQIEQMLSSLSSLDDRIEGMEDHRQANRQSQITQWIMAGLALLTVCGTMFGAFRSSLEMMMAQQTELVMVHISEINKKLDKLEQKSYKDTEQDVEIAKNSQAIGSLRGWIEKR